MAQRYIKDIFTGEYCWITDNGPKRTVFGKAAEPKSRGGIQVIKDLEPYRSAVTGEVISGRRQHRDHIRAHELIEVGTEKLKPRTIDPLPPVQQDIRASIEMVNGGYRPPRYEE